MICFDGIPETRNMINVLSDHPKDENFTELHTAVKENKVTLVETIIGNKDIINSQTKNGITSLLLSCLLPVETNIAKMLMQSGADVNISDKVGFTPLLAACKTQKLEIVEILLKCGANINHQDDCDYTALHYAVENDNLQLVDLLLRSGADTSLPDCNGWNALMMALHEYEHEHCAEMILPFTKNVNSVAFNNWSALMLATANVSKELIIKLVERGADVNINVDGVMPVTLALERRDPYIFDYLWDLTDIEILKKGDELYNFIEVMITSDWITPPKIRYFYKVLDTPGVKIESDYGYIRALANFMSDFNTDEEFLSVDVYGIMKKLFEKGAQIIDIDIEGFISMCYRYNFDYKCKLLKVFIDYNVDLNILYYAYFTIRNDPEFALVLMQYSISYHPEDVLKYIIISHNKRLDIPMLKLIRYILKLCTPVPKLRQDCLKHLKTFEVMKCDCFYYTIEIAALEFNYKKYIKHELTPQEKLILPALYNEVIDLLSENRVPTLKEMSRDRIRQSLFRACSTTQDFLYRLNKLHLPTFMLDIIQCKSVVCSSQ